MRLFFCLILMSTFVSCTIEKRLVNKGYHVKWHHQLWKETTRNTDSTKHQIGAEVAKKADASNFATNKIENLLDSHIVFAQNTNNIQTIGDDKYEDVEILEKDYSIVEKNNVTKKVTIHETPHSPKKQQKLRDLEEKYSRNVYLAIFCFELFFVTALISGLLGVISPIIAGIIGFIGFIILFLSFYYSVKGMKDMTEEENKSGFMIASIPIATVVLTAIFALYAMVLINSPIGIAIILTLSLLFFIAFIIARIRLKHNPFKRFIVFAYLLITALLLLMMPLFPYQG